jgi:Secretion system C-terminal sorting domain
MLTYTKSHMTGKIKYLFALIFLFSYLSFSQGMMHSGNFNSDSLKPINVSGKLIADSSMMNGMYYLDANNDNKPDYILNLGPIWYKPDSSIAVRPRVGDTIAITGGVYDGMLNYLPMIVVYTINGNFWRSPSDALWNEMGHHSMMGGSGHMGMGYAFGWDHDSLKSISLDGKVIVDSTFMYNHYYLDSNNDGSPDYFLNFGPPWYTPPSGASIPGSGNIISVSGWEMRGFMNMIIVNKLNGQIWRDSTQLNDSLGCGWIHKNMTQTKHFFAPFDSSDWMEVSPGWNSGGMGGGMMSDSLYCQIMEIFPKNVPSDSAQNTMAAYEVAMFLPNGMNGMSYAGGMGGHMDFTSNVRFQFHFNNSQANGFNINSGNMKVKYWENKTNQWINASNPVINAANNTITVSQSEVSNFYIITADKLTGITSDHNSVPDMFSLRQNYPNPFNPSTTIEFSLKENSNVNLSVYNILGQKVVTLLNQPMSAGIHNVQFNASGLSSGIYFYRITTGNENKVMKMNLLK